MTAFFIWIFIIRFITIIYIRSYFLKIPAHRCIKIHQENIVFKQNNWVHLLMFSIEYSYLYFLRYSFQIHRIVTSTNIKNKNIFVKLKFHDPINLNFSLFSSFRHSSQIYFYLYFCHKKFKSNSSKTIVLKFPLHIVSDILSLQMIPPSASPCIRIVYDTRTYRNYNTQLHRAFVRRVAAWPLINLVCMSECFSSIPSPWPEYFIAKTRMCRRRGRPLEVFSSPCLICVPVAADALLISGNEMMAAIKFWVILFKLR